MGMTPEQKAMQLLQDLNVVLELFRKANWPDTKAGNAACNLANNLISLQEWTIAGAKADTRKEV